MTRLSGGPVQPWANNYISEFSEPMWTTITLLYNSERASWLPVPMDNLVILEHLFPFGPSRDSSSTAPISSLLSKGHDPIMEDPIAQSLVYLTGHSAESSATQLQFVFRANLISVGKLL